jgi:hypothetical protein
LSHLADQKPFCTFLSAKAGVEVTFEETRSHRGVETQRQWSDKAILRTTPVEIPRHIWKRMENALAQATQIGQTQAKTFLAWSMAKRCSVYPRDWDRKAAMFLPHETIRSFYTQERKCEVSFDNISHDKI